MANIRKVSPYAGITVKVKDHVGADPMTGSSLAEQDFTIEDWWENVYGCSWMCSDGNPAALNYAFRVGVAAYRIPLDNDVLYGKIGSFGFLFHVSELCFPEVE